MEQIQQLKQWFYSLPTKEQWMVSGTGVIIIITLFYLIVWEPLHLGLQEEQQKQQSQKEIMLWMQQAATEAKSLRSAGGRSTGNADRLRAHRPRCAAGSGSRTDCGTARSAPRCPWPRRPR